MNDRKANKKRTGMTGGKVPKGNRASGKNPGNAHGTGLPSAMDKLPYHLGRRWY